MTQETTDFVAILAHSSLAAARPNRLKPGTPPTFYAEVCFPPEAAGALQALAASIAPGGNLAGLQVGVKLNSQKTKPIPGVPGDWFVVRSSTQFAPYVADAAGQQLVQGDPAVNARIGAMFYAGKKVRAALSPFSWTFQGRSGISFNLTGVMEAGDAERLNIGSGVTANAFAKYANPNAAAPAAAPAQAANPFATPTTGTPLAQANQPSTSANPFAQQPAANPFG